MAIHQRADCGPDPAASRKMDDHEPHGATLRKKGSILRELLSLEANMAVKPIPNGYHSITPYLVVKGAAKVIDFAKAAFGAQEIMRMLRADGAIAHAEIRVGDSVVMIADAEGVHPPRPANLMLYVPNVDDVYRRALAAGGKSDREPADQFYGDRNAGVHDAAGNYWWIATHVEDVSPDELARRAAAEAKSK